MNRSPGAADRVRHQLRAASFKTHGKDLHCLLERYDTRREGTLSARQIEDGVLELLPDAVPLEDLRALFDAVRGQDLDYRQFLEFTPVQQYVRPADMDEAPATTAAGSAATASSPSPTPRAPATRANAADATAPSSQLSTHPGSAIGSGAAVADPIRIMHLCERDKSKVAKLIQQLVKSGNDCERLEAQLATEREAHNERLAKLREQNTTLAAEVAAGRAKQRKSLTMLRAYQERLLTLQPELDAAKQGPIAVTAEAQSLTEAEAKEKREAPAFPVEQLLREIQALREDQRATQQMAREQAALGAAHEAEQKLREVRARDILEAERQRLEHEMHERLEREREAMLREVREEVAQERESALRSKVPRHSFAGLAAAPTEPTHALGRAQQADEQADGVDATVDGACSVALEDTDEAREKRALLKELSRLRAEQRSKASATAHSEPGAPEHNCPGAADLAQEGEAARVSAVAVTGNGSNDLENVREKATEGRYRNAAQCKPDRWDHAPVAPALVP